METKEGPEEEKKKRKRGQIGRMIHMPEKMKRKRRYMLPARRKCAEAKEKDDYYSGIIVALTILP